MERHDREKKKADPQARPEHRESGERPIAPPIEREHETQKGVFEEDEKRERERH